MSKDLNAYKWLEENDLSYDIWNYKYRNDNESFDFWLDRVSNKNKYIKKLILDKKFLFGGRTLSNRGTNKGSYSNCYSTGYVPDSLEGILQVNTELAMTYKAQGGQGISLSKIRPKGSFINNSFTSDGIEPFMEIFNTTTSSISQGGSRKGALMMSLDIWHPEAEKFITIKSNLNKINKANLSLEIDDEFMNIVIKDSENNTVTTVDRVFKYQNNKEFKYQVTPIKLFKLLCNNALKYAEPGVIFTGKFRNYNLMEKVNSYSVETSNPLNLAA